MKELNELDDAAVFTFAEQNKFDEVIVSLAMLNDAPVEMMARLVEGPRADLILIPCRSAKLNWPTVETILRNRPVQPPISEATLEQAQRDYRRLSIETAQRTVRFWQLHNRIEKAAPKPCTRCRRGRAGLGNRRACAVPDHRHSASSRSGTACALCPPLQFRAIAEFSVLGLVDQRAFLIHGIMSRELCADFLDRVLRRAWRGSP